MNTGKGNFMMNKTNTSSGLNVRSAEFQRPMSSNDRININSKEFMPSNKPLAISPNQI